MTRSNREFLMRIEEREKKMVKEYKPRFVAHDLIHPDTIVRVRRGGIDNE